MPSEEERQTIPPNVQEELEQKQVKAHEAKVALEVLLDKVEEARANLDVVFDETTLRRVDEMEGPDLFEPFYQPLYGCLRRMVSVATPGGGQVRFRISETVFAPEKGTSTKPATDVVLEVGNLDLSVRFQGHDTNEQRARAKVYRKVHALRDALSRVIELAEEGEDADASL